MKSLLAIAFVLITSHAAPAQEIKKEDAANPVALMTTNFGDVYIELFPKEAPKTVANFTGLAGGTREFTDIKTKKKTRRPYYDGLTFHRVIKNFMIQGGDPRGDGTGGPGYHFEDEINASHLGINKLRAMPNGQPHRFLPIRNRTDFQRVILGPLFRVMGIKTQKDFERRIEEVKKRTASLTLKEAYENQGYRYSDTLKSRHPKKGVIAMANAGPNTNGSQFFINLTDTPWLAGRHTVFGKVVKGMDVVEKIGETPVGQGGKPNKTVRIIKIRVKK